MIHRAVLLVAHGSREKSANDEVRALAERIGNVFGEKTHVQACFLEIEAPSIEEAFEQAVGAGAKTVVACPFFLASGIHVRRDIPAILKRCEERFPETQVSITAALGPAPEFERIVLNRLAEKGMEVPPVSDRIEE